MSPLRVFALSHYCGLGTGSIPLRAIVNKTQCEMRGGGVMTLYNNNHNNNNTKFIERRNTVGRLKRRVCRWSSTILNKRCKILPRCIRPRNDLYCVGWGVKLYSLTHSLTHFGARFKSQRNRLKLNFFTTHI